MAAGHGGRAAARDFLLPTSASPQPTRLGHASPRWPFEGPRIQPTRKSAERPGVLLPAHPAKTLIDNELDSIRPVELPKYAAKSRRQLRNGPPFVLVRCLTGAGAGKMIRIPRRPSVPRCSCWNVSSMNVDDGERPASPVRTLLGPWWLNPTVDVTPAERRTVFLGVSHIPCRASRSARSRRLAGRLVPDLSLHQCLTTMTSHRGGLPDVLHHPKPPYL